MVTHHHLGLHRSYSLKCYAYNDEYGGTAHSDLNAADSAEDDREDSDDTEEDSAHEGDLREYPFEVVAGGLTGSDAGYVSTLFLNVVTNLQRVECYGGVEVCEEYHQYYV